MLGLNVESGRLQRLRTVEGSFAALAVVFFTEDSGFTRNFVGQTGWLDCAYEP